MIRWLPVALLCLVAGVMGLRAGLSQEPDASVAIARVAASYAQTHPGARPEDCVAVPGQGEVWLLVTCTQTSGAEPVRYSLDANGAVIERADET
ncbi:hypothetical protein [Palleronia caenipelagi]|uniref:PepSY domain-containing protein n=1 Tax=Palleronia caenipelagi TaxID=2489174 RepID=A0A547Q542_9RHOB|nr:hypothetical protein [Palleronia caenipelagi]TRD21494.1 hypothetical protein FEV53_08405 [Palleronia caenipelagi]